MMIIFVYLLYLCLLQTIHGLPAPWSMINFMIFDEKSENYFNYNYNVSLQNNGQIEAISLCNHIGIPHNFSQCISNSLHTHRYLRIVISSQYFDHLIMKYSIEDALRRDFLILSTSHIYENSIVDKSITKVCILGPINWQLVLHLLLTCPNYQLWLFTDYLVILDQDIFHYLQEIFTERVFTILIGRISSTFNTFLKSFSNNNSYDSDRTKLLLTHCNIIHIRDNDYKKDISDTSMNNSKIPKSTEDNIEKINNIIANFLKLKSTPTTYYTNNNCSSSNHHESTCHEININPIYPINKEKKLSSIIIYESEISNQLSFQPIKKSFLPHTRNNYYESSEHSPSLDDTMSSSTNNNYAKKSSTLALTWKMSTIFTTYQNINFKFDSQGFLAKTYQDADPTSKVSRIMIGTLTYGITNSPPTDTTVTTEIVNDISQRKLNDTSSSISSSDTVIASKSSSSFSSYSNSSCRKYKTRAIIITYTNRFFEDTASGLLDALTSLYFPSQLSSSSPMKTSGYTDISLLHTNLPYNNQLDSKNTHFFLTIEIIPDFTWEIYSQLISSVDEEPLQIAIGPHELLLLLDNYIAFQMEQVWSLYFTSPSFNAYHMLLQRALQVWVFCPSHVITMIALGYSNVQIIPIYPRKELLLSNFFPMNKISNNDNNSSISNRNRNSDRETFEEFINNFKNLPIDVAFFGSGSSRRSEILNTIDAKNKALSEKKLTFYCISGSWETALIDKRRDYIVKNSKIVLNVHTEDRSSLEVHRINYLISFGKIIVSERSSDVMLDSQYDDAIVFSKKEELFETLVNLLQNNSKLFELRNKAVEKIVSVGEDLDPLRDALREIYF